MPSDQLPILPDSSDERLLISLMSRVQSPITRALYGTIARHFVFSAIESVILREIDGKLCIFLQPRGDDDPHWPGALHSPGSIVRETDAPLAIGVAGSLRSVFERLEREELGVRFKGEPEYAGLLFVRTDRGAELSHVYLCEIESTPEIGDFYPVDALPENFLQLQMPLVAMAADAFRARKTKM